jgi:NADPH:quinone reductase-like Zn-dependent oxidoreductase
VGLRAFLRISRRASKSNAMESVTRASLAFWTGWRFPGRLFRRITISKNVTKMQGKALWYVAPGRAELREETVAAPKPGEVQVRSLFGAISRGTERLIHAGRVPASEYERMRAPLMAGTFPFPVKYGYATVGRVEAGDAELRRRIVFSLYPHQSVFTLSAEAVFAVPEHVSPRRAVLAANMETALNAVWDGAPGPADRIAVVGGGLVGLLVAYLCARLPAAEVTVVDIASARANLAHGIGARFATPDAAPGDCDLVFHASGTATGLATALRVAGEESSIVELSWYGSGDVASPLGEAFHSRRLRLLSSQVGRVAPSHRPRWTPRRRLMAALALLEEPVLDILLGPSIAFDDLPAKLPSILGYDSEGMCPLIRYPAADETS